MGISIDADKFGKSEIISLYPRMKYYLGGMMGSMNR